MQKKIELDREKVSSLYESGTNMRKIGEALGVSNLVICQFMIKHNIKARKYKKIGVKNE